jgi:hypothetical protein
MRLIKAKVLTEKVYQLLAISRNSTRVSHKQEAALCA